MVIRENKIKKNVFCNYTQVSAPTKSHPLLFLKEQYCGGTHNCVHPYNNCIVEYFFRMTLGWSLFDSSLSLPSLSQTVSRLRRADYQPLRLNIFILMYICIHDKKFYIIFNSILSSIWKKRVLIQ